MQSATYLENPCDKKWRDHWNGLKPNQRKKLLKDAGYHAATNWMYRTWDFVESSIRTDVIYAITRQQRDQNIGFEQRVAKAAETAANHPSIYQQ